MITIIPFPKKATEYSGTPHNIPLLITADPRWQSEISVFSQLFEQIFEVTLTEGKGGIELRFDAGVAPDAYILDTETVATIRASGREGLLYGMASALQIMTVSDGSICLPAVSVEDHPDKPFRSFMLDLGFATQPFEKLRKFVDLCFLYKINYLHVHFADNSFYSLPSREFPELPTKGKHYSFEQIRQFDAYAASRGIRIIPEFECPGHAELLNKRYRNVFGCQLQGDTEAFYNEQGDQYSNDALLCAGSEAAFDGVKRLLKEIAEMFPNAPYIHIGGDEAQHELWGSCAHCKAYMEKHGITSTKELYGEYMGRVASYVLSLGKTPIVWEGFPRFTNHYIPKETVVIAWESHYQLVTELLEDGFHVINASWQPLYLVDSLNRRWTPEDILNWNVYNWQHWWPHSYATLNPITVAPTDRVLGATLCHWALTYEQLMSRLMENLAAMSERVWTVERKRETKEYNQVFKKLYRIAAALVQDR